MTMTDTMHTTTPKHSNNRAWAIFAAALAATALLVWGGTTLDNQSQDHSTDHLVEQLCDQTPDC
jgi:hypothetical protein